MLGLSPTMRIIEHHGDHTGALVPIICWSYWVEVSPARTPRPGRPDVEHPDEMIVEPAAGEVAPKITQKDINHEPE